MSSSTYYRVFPGGTRPENVTNLIDAITALLRSGSEATKAQTAHFTDDRPLLVPVSPDLDRETALELLNKRITEPVPDSVDVILQTSGSTTGRGHLVGLSARALRASAEATLSELNGPGRWILALPTHHIAGFQVLVRAILSQTRPIVLDTEKGFRTDALVRAIERATSREEKRLRALFEASGLDYETDQYEALDDPQLQRSPLYISLVPTQLHKILEDEAATHALTQVDAILLGGSHVSSALKSAAKKKGLNVVTTYGMTETCGGCVYDGMPLTGMQVATIDNRVWISGTALMETYVDDPSAADFVVQGHRRWLRTKDSGHMDGPRLVVDGRIDDVITTGGVKIQASLVEQTIADMPEIDDVCVVGVPEVRWGHLVTAVCVISDEADPRVIAPLLRLCALPTQYTEDEPSQPDAPKPLDYRDKPLPKAQLTPLEAAMAAMAARIRGEEVDVVEAAKTGELPYNIYQIGRADADSEADESDDNRLSADLFGVEDAVDIPVDGTQEQVHADDSLVESAPHDGDEMPSHSDDSDEDAQSEDINESTFAVQIRGRVARELDRAHAPRAIIVVDSLPMLASGKVDRQEVQRMATVAVHSHNAWLR